MIPRFLSGLRRSPGIDSSRGDDDMKCRIAPGIRRVEQPCGPRRVVDDLAGIAGRIRIERTEALHDHLIPCACNERRLLVGMNIQVHLGSRFEADVVGEARLAGEKP
jgi:hypothetical protein